ncbi:hypothetical protein, partial [Cryobacterium sp. Y11]|uniref:hypothetical protein n=1 Tax=Cryobacterium sp. Y11 TaxID=2045016 RepID=UPI0011B080DC
MSAPAAHALGATGFSGGGIALIAAGLLVAGFVIVAVRSCRRDFRAVGSVLAVACVVAMLTGVGFTPAQAAQSSTALATALTPVAFDAVDFSHTAQAVTAAATLTADDLTG